MTSKPVSSPVEEHDHDAVLERAAARHAGAEREPFLTTERLLRINFGLTLLLTVVMTFLIYSIVSVMGSQTSGKERGYRTRAEDCRIQVSLNIPLDSNCLDPHVTAYYDPQEQTFTFRQEMEKLMCSIAIKEKLESAPDICK